MNRVRFHVNGVENSVGSEVSSDVTLMDYLRNTLRLTGTKYMCREAGCGACIVTATFSQNGTPAAVNSCMVIVTSCEGWNITTIDGLGNRSKGYHILQKTLAEKNGTQCGHCTSGWIMAMNSLLQNKHNLTMLEIEQSFGSNVCRCTGYRTILDAFKGFAADAPESKRITDIEDLHICKHVGDSCEKNDCTDYDWCIVNRNDIKESIIHIKLQDCRDWYRVQELKHVFEIFEKKGNDSYMLVAGNTAKGAYPIKEYPRLLVDINGVSELKGFIIDQNLVLGAGETLSNVLKIFMVLSKQQNNFNYLQKLNAHIKMVAHIAVRNIGTISGNLMIKHQHNEFPSDLFLLFETVGAQLTILSPSGKKEVSMQDFLKVNMRGKIILNVVLPPLSASYKIVTFKIMPRSQNVHAIVHSGFLFKLSASGTVQECRLVFGGLSSNFSRARNTEKFLINKPLFRNETLQSAIKVLNRELIITRTLPELSVEYRRHLTIGLFYKGLLTLCPESISSPYYRSGAVMIHDIRPASRGSQATETHQEIWPLTEPIPKVDALIQCSGEAVYTEDIPPYKNEVFVSFVLSTIPVGNLEHIDSKKALAEPGVIAFYSANDIPGMNTFAPTGRSNFYAGNEEILCDGSVKYYNQPIGFIVAESRAIADRAAKLVVATYSKVRKPVIDVRLAKTIPSRISLYSSQPATNTGTDIVKIIRGYMAIYHQYHFCMETLTSISLPIEQGLEVYAATQYVGAIQDASSRALNMEQSSIDVYVRRVGGGYGYKISRIIQGAIACSMAALKLNRPCRFIQALTTNTRAVGKRMPSTTDFEVGVNTEGTIQYLNCDFYLDNGYVVNELLIQKIISVFNNCYAPTRWNFKFYNVVTDTASNSWFRSPGSLEGIANAELIMERISYELSLDPVSVRLANLDSVNHNAIREMWEDLKIKSEFNEKRSKVKKFNTENRWIKRGMRVAFMRWKCDFSQYMSATLSVYHEDGSVAITHGGVEIGQGINTKAAQVCAYFLKIPLNKIRVKRTNTISSPNVYETGGSVTSQNMALGVQRCCEELLRRLEPIRSKMNNPSWETLIQSAFQAGVNLKTHGFVSPGDALFYDVYGVIISEVEIDIITGQWELLRVDLLEDVGQSLNPQIDIGQIEGAFIMGLGYWTCEKLELEPNTGEVLSDRTWNYWVPQARDIPQDFKVYFRKRSSNYELYLGAKATGEPATTLAVVVPLSMREAITSARLDSGIPSEKWFQIDGPYTTEQICLAAATKFEDFKYY